MNTQTQFEVNLLEADSKRDEYDEAGAAVGERLTELIANADSPAVVAEAVLKAATAVQPKVRYTAGGRARGLGLLRRFAPAAAVDAGIHKNLRLDTVAVSLHRILVSG